VNFFSIVRDQQTTAKRKRKPQRKADSKVPAKKEEGDDKVDEAIALVLDTAEALQAERGGDHLWGSMIKQTLKRRRPGFNESFYGLRSFSDLLEEAESRGHVKLEMDERSGGYLVRLVS
jgi:hypothetical protein